MPRWQFCLLLLLNLPSCDNSQADEPKTAGASSATAADEEQTVRDPVLVRVAPVKIDTIENKLKLPATVESLDSVDIISERAEPVLQVLVEEGDFVEEGQILARLRTKVCELALDEARVRLTEANNALEQSKRDHQRNKGLAENIEGRGQLITRSELEESAQQLINAETTQAAAEVSIERAEFDLSNCTIRSPIAGVVTARDVSVGDYANVGQRLFQITDLSEPKAIFHRPQRELAVLRVGQKLSATSEALVGTPIHGVIERIAPTVDSMSGTVKVTASLNADGVQIPAGILVNLELILGRHEDAMLVPKRALLYEGRQPYCFAVRDETAVRIDCQPGFETPDFLEVLPGPDSLRPDDVVVVVGADRLAAGDPVVLAEEE